MAAGKPWFLVYQTVSLACNHSGAGRSLLQAPCQQRLAAMALLRAVQTVLAQDVDGHVKPIPHDEDFAEGSAVVADADLALAIRLQEEEMSHVSMPAPLPSSARSLRRCFFRAL